MRAPGRCNAIRHGQFRVGVAGDVDQGEIIVVKRLRQGDEGQCNQKALRIGGMKADAHPGLIGTVCSLQGCERLHKRHRKGKPQPEMPQLRNHGCFTVPDCIG